MTATLRPLKLTASPTHADVICITGTVAPWPRSTRQPLTIPTCWRSFIKTTALFALIVWLIGPGAPRFFHRRSHGHLTKFAVCLFYFALSAMLFRFSAKS